MAGGAPDMPIPRIGPKSLNGKTVFVAGTRLSLPLVLALMASRSTVSISMQIKKNENNTAKTPQA